MKSGQMTTRKNQSLHGSSAIGILTGVSASKIDKCSYWVRWRPSMCFVADRTARSLGEEQRARPGGEEKRKQTQKRTRMKKMKEKMK